MSFVPRSQCKLALMCARLSGWLLSPICPSFQFRRCLFDAARLYCTCLVKGNASWKMQPRRYVRAGPVQVVTAEMGFGDRKEETDRQGLRGCQKRCCWEGEVTEQGTV